MSDKDILCQAIMFYLDANEDMLFRIARYKTNEPFFNTGRHGSWRNELSLKVQYVSGLLNATSLRH
ncbi:hypothetical protein OLMES_0173 [Oleiphilus messinensis]|uniref:Uncharacterized protein n=1 Tax=Oleiphilus messinensis TaxID=141451 RepID=A0A1Y0I1J8_9GAMM|nr:hypothetical protein OLMES_0173 [Oleiphilus messinensis]